MSDADVAKMEDGEGDETEEGGSGGKKKLSGKKLVLFIALPLLLLLIGGGAGAFFFLMGDDWSAGEHGEAAANGEGGRESGGPIVFYDLPEMLVNLNSGGKRASYLKITVALELQDAAAVAKLEKIMPRVVHNFQVYLRELRLEDLKGSAGLLRLKEELLIRVQRAAGAVKVNDVLFKEMLVQ
jgi:flagellar FliL protein